MILTLRDNLFVCDPCAFEERLLPKAARFRWNPELKCWWTDDALRAVQLIAFADESCRAQLERVQADHAAALAASRATDAAIDIPVPAGLAYLPYQRAGIAFALRVFKDA